MGVLWHSNDTVPSKVVAEHVKNRKKATVQAAVRAVAEPESTVNVDALKSYNGLAKNYFLEVVGHAIEFVRDNVHTNGMENFWSLFKRALKDTYVSVDPMHLNAYTVEQTFRFNKRKDVDGGRFRKVLGAVSGKRVTYKELTCHAPQRLRERNAKVEGRDPPELPRGTMAPFRALTAKLLKVPMSEVKEQHRIYEDRHLIQKEISPKPRKKITAAFIMISCE